MAPNSDLEIQGSIITHPFAELLVEIGGAGLNGALRIFQKDHKVVVYFKAGQVVFAVSNARSSRIFDMMLSRGTISREELTRVPSFQNDFEFTAYLQDKGSLSKEDTDRLFAEQIEKIIVDVLSWREGIWTFSSLARIRDGLSFNIDTTKLLLGHGRTQGIATALSRFRSLEESFERSLIPKPDVILTPEEAFILSRADSGALTAADISSVSAMSKDAACKIIYTLWLGGLLTRQDWQPAFSEELISLMRTAKLELKKEARLSVASAASEPVSKAPSHEAPGEQPQQAPAPKETVTLEDYLARVENADTYYDILGIETKADIPEIKRAYFSLAKMFHPDLFHAEGGITLQRVQKAFTELAQAHETLKSNETRDLYDYRMRKELAVREQNHGSKAAASSAQRKEQAEEQFEHGFDLLMGGNTEEAVPFLARAVHYDPENARYHAYYGKALSDDEGQRHKAEQEMQTAVRIDPNNATYRILLAEFFIQYNLLKRAEGELNRLLAIFPTNREAHELLATINR